MTSLNFGQFFTPIPPSSLFFSRHKILDPLPLILTSFMDDYFGRSSNFLPRRSSLIVFKASSFNSTLSAVWRNHQNKTITYFFFFAFLRKLFGSRFVGMIQKYIQALVNDRPSVYNDHNFKCNFKLLLQMWLLNNDHLSTTTTIFGSQGWSLYTEVWL